ncbi:MAG TPA: ABC transporter ATP-binding protein [bacterium]
MIEVRQISKAFRDVQALRGIAFRVGKGEIIGLVGKNGAGKSTTLKVLSGQLLPSAGDALVDGCSVVNDPLEVRRRIGYLPETPPLYPEMTPRSYLLFAAQLRGVAGPLARGRVDDVIAKTGLEPVATRPMLGLSRGYQQRVGIAQAIVHNPPVLLLDEPMAGLDPLQIVQIRELIRSLKHDHTLLFSSHILAEITNVCDRIVLIDQGQVKAEGSEAELRKNLLQSRRLVATVLGDRAKLVAALQKIPGVSVTAEAGSEPGTVTARIQAESTAGDPRERVSRACAEAGLALLELRAEDHGLEDLFLMVLGDPSKSGATGGKATP